MCSPTLRMINAFEYNGQQHGLKGAAAVETETVTETDTEAGLN